MVMVNDWLNGTGQLAMGIHDSRELAIAQSGRTMKIPTFHVKMVRDRTARLPCNTPSIATAILRKLCCDRGDREIFVVLYLDAQSQIMGAEVVSIGIEGNCQVSVTTVLRGAIISGAHGIILGHNHPSRNVTPSPEDRAVTSTIKLASDLVGISTIDHIIVSDDGGAFSFVANGLM